MASVQISVVVFVLIIGTLSPFVSSLPAKVTPQQQHEDSPGELGKYFEGDMLTDPRKVMNRAGIIGEEYRWPNGVVPYDIHPDFDNEDRLLILTGLAHLEKYTCLRFVPRTFEKDYVLVNYGGPGSGYYSDVGRTGGRQILNLEPRLVDNSRFGTVVHEFIHAIGYFHEQSRTDRDDYVTINWENIMPGLEHNFEKYSADEVDSHGVPYDYSSIMHYPPRGFAIDPNVDTIIVPEGVTIGLRQRTSAYDVQKINNMYNCPPQKN